MENKLKQLRNQSDSAVETFRSQVAKIENSKNPKFKDSEVKEYELAQAKATLDDTAEEITRQHKGITEQALSEATAEAAKSYYEVSGKDKQLVDHHAESFISDVALAQGDPDKQKAFARLESAMEHMSASQLSGLKKQLPTILGGVNGDKQAVRKLKALNSSLSALKTPEEERLAKVKVAAEESPQIKYNTLRLVHPMYKSYQSQVRTLK